MSTSNVIPIGRAKGIRIAYQPIEWVERREPVEGEVAVAGVDFVQAKWPALMLCQAFAYYLVEHTIAEGRV